MRFGYRWWSRLPDHRPFNFTASPWSCVRKYLGPAANSRIARQCAVAAGEHEVVLREPRCQEYTTTVKIEAGRTITVCKVVATSR